MTAPITSKEAAEKVGTSNAKQLRVLLRAIGFA